MRTDDSIKLLNTTSEVTTRFYSSSTFIIALPHAAITLKWQT